VTPDAQALSLWAAAKLLRCHPDNVTKLVGSPVTRAAVIAELRRRAVAAATTAAKENHPVPQDMSGLYVAKAHANPQGDAPAPTALAVAAEALRVKQEAAKAAKETA
jgi:hypothetical protein